MSLRLCFETRATAGRIASSSTRSASLGEFWTQVDSSLAAVDALKTLGAPARGLPWTCRFVVISTFYFAYEIARYALSKRELRSRVNAHAPATTLRYRPKKFYYGFFRLAPLAVPPAAPLPPRRAPRRRARRFLLVLQVAYAVLTSSFLERRRRYGLMVFT